MVFRVLGIGGFDSSVVRFCGFEGEVGICQSSCEHTLDWQNLWVLTNARLTLRFGAARQRKIGRCAAIGYAP